MKKVLFSILLMMLTLILLTGCQTNITVLKKPDDTNLEFWITENVENVDFSEYEEIYGWFGAREYLGRGYKTIITEDGTPTRPEVYVSYIITAYPDYADGGQYVTEIRIKDPKVTLYGLTINSSLDIIDDVFTNMGYKIDKLDELSHRATNRRITFTYGDGQIVIQAKVTNRYNIVF